MPIPSVIRFRRRSLRFTDCLWPRFAHGILSAILQSYTVTMKWHSWMQMNNSTSVQLAKQISRLITSCRAVLHIQAFTAGLLYTTRWVCNVYWCNLMPDGGLLLAHRNHSTPKMSTGSKTLRLSRAINKQPRRSNLRKIIDDVDSFLREIRLYSMYLDGIRRDRSASTACPDGFFDGLRVETLVTLARSALSHRSIFWPSSSPVVVVISSAGVCPSVIGPPA